jgi:hypothetical protein
LFCDCQRIIHFDTQVSNRILQLRMAEEKLYRPQILRVSVDQSDLCSTQGVGSVFVMLKANYLHPRVDDSGVLARRKRRKPTAATGKKDVSGTQTSSLNPGFSTLRQAAD